MAFTPDTLSVIVQPIGGTGIRFLSYRSDDSAATITGSGYFTSALSFGVRKYDLIVVTPITGAVESYIVIVTDINAVTGNGTAVLEPVLTPASIGVLVQAYSANLDEFATVNPSAFGLSLLDDADASAAQTTLGISAFVKTLLDAAAATNVLTTLGFSTFIKTLIDDADASAAQTTLGISTFVKTILDDADASAVLSTLGVSTFIKTLLDDADAATALATLGAPAITSGSYTPTVVSSGGTITTLGTRTAIWTRIGDVCCVEIEAAITTIGSASGSINMGLPFNAASGTGAVLAAANTAVVTTGTGFISPGGNTVNVFKYDGTLIAGSGSVIRASGCYKV